MKTVKQPTTLVALFANIKATYLSYVEKREIRNTALLLSNMSERQKEDINFYGRDLNKYNQYLF